MKTPNKQTCYRVVVRVKGNKPETHFVFAAREGVAKTLAMMLYSQPLSGQLVEYDFAQVSDAKSLKIAAANQANFDARSKAWADDMRKRQHGDIK